MDSPFSSRVLQSVPRHKWAVGTTFEWQFDFLMPTNPFHEPETKQKAKNTRQPRTARPSKPKITKSPTAQPKQAKAPKDPKRATPTPEEHKQHSPDHTTETAAEARETA